MSLLKIDGKLIKYNDNLIKIISDNDNPAEEQIKTFSILGRAILGTMILGKENMNYDL